MSSNELLIVAQLLVAESESFVTAPVNRMRLAFGGLDRDRHFGATRPACARTPWHPRGTPIANTRQLSIVSTAECAAIAERLGIARIEPRLIGANLVIDGAADLTGLAPSTRLMFPGGATLFVTEENLPCRHAGRMLALDLGEPQLELEFVQAAQGRRGLMALVEREGEIAVGETIKVIAPRPRRLG